MSQRRLSLPTGFSAGGKCVEASGDVIENESTRLSTAVYWTLVLRLNRRARRHPTCVDKIEGDVRVHRDYGKRFIVSADEKPTAFLELE